jgi:glucose-6-phosphate 1-epimerase
MQAWREKPHRLNSEGEIKMATAVGESFRRTQYPASATVAKGNGGLQAVRVSCPQSAGEIYLHGAHITSWKPAGREEVLFLSSRSRWEDGHAIRGGVPICFPWFGGKTDNPEAPAHGFVRTKSWQLESIAQVDDGIRVCMFTESDEGSKRWWPGDFHLAYRVTFGTELGLELVMTNTGKTAQRFEEALHAYHKVENILKTRVAGLDRVQYIDKTDSNRRKIQNGEIAIVSETDRVYLDTSGAIEMEDPESRRRTRVAKENSRTTVVWNPWVQKARSMSDFDDNEWIKMICIETSNVADFAVDLVPGQQHTMKAVVTVEEL